MTQGAQLQTVAQVRTFMLAGNSRFTLQSVKTGTRFTFKLAVADDTDDLFFLSVLTGPDNMSDYTYVGTIRAQRFQHGRKSKIGFDAPSVVAFKWFWEMLSKDRIPSTVEFWHEGRCGRCSRVLTDPGSIASGFGPECRNHIPKIETGTL